MLPREGQHPRTGGSAQSRQSQDLSDFLQRKAECLRLLDKTQFFNRRFSVPAVPCWLAWGPYLWADGMRPRSDGLTWACSDLAADGTHPSDDGRRKVADMLLGFMNADATAREWYLR